jgi:hypothetical protein
MSGVYISSFMTQGERENITFVGDTSYLEDHKALETMARIEQGHRQTEVLDKQRTKGARLPTLAAGFNNDPSIVSELQDKKEEVKKI